jgi:hypothetical protein
MALDYQAILSGGRISPLQKAFQGYQMGTSIRKQQEQSALLEAKKAQIAEQQAQAQAMQFDLAALAEKEDAGAQDYSRMMLKYPNLSEHLKKSFEVLNEDQRRSKEGQAYSLYSALETGDIDTAKELLNQQKSAAEESGLMDEANAAEIMLKSIEQNPNSVKVSTGLALSQLMGAEKFQQLQERIRTGAGKIKEIELRLKAIKSGELPDDPETKFKAESDLRKEYGGVTKSFQDVRDANLRVMAVEDTAAGDVALIFNFMKMLDPGSVIRESEYATAQRAGGALDRAQVLYQRLLSGESLSETQRKMFKSQAKKLYDAAKDQEKKVREHMQRIAKEAGLNVENIIYTAPAEKKAPASEPTPPQTPIQQETVTTEVQTEVAPVPEEELSNLDKY